MAGVLLERHERKKHLLEEVKECVQQVLASEEFRRSMKAALKSVSEQEEVPDEQSRRDP